ncbi:MAG: putative iron-regulated protein [Bermanella sp.]
MQEACNYHHKNCRARIFIVFLLPFILACSAKPSEAEKRAVLAAYREQAYRVYDDAYQAARLLYRDIDVLVQQPSNESLLAARKSWRAARVPYSQTEALRFGHWFVDEWEAKVNSWPIDEGFIDYVDDAYQASATNVWARANIVGSDSIVVAGRDVPLNYIVFKQLQMLESVADVEAVVVTGYHALEFLLWGQDRHGTERGAGERPWADFSIEHCTNGPLPAESDKPCRKRGEFLKTVAILLMRQLQEMREHWGPGAGTPGDRLVRGDADAGLNRVLFGLAAMSTEELAGERMQVALLTHAPEEEQDCFSDDTHNSLWYNAKSIENFYYARYEGRSSLSIPAHSLAALAARYYPELAAQLDEAFKNTREAMQAIREQGESQQQFVDQMIAEGSVEGNALFETAINHLQLQAVLLNSLADNLGIQLVAPAALGKAAQ